MKLYNYPEQHKCRTDIQEHLQCSFNVWSEYSTALLIKEGFMTPEGEILRPWHWDHVVPVCLPPNPSRAPGWYVSPVMTEEMSYERLSYTNLYPTTEEGNLKKGRWFPGPPEPVNATGEERDVLMPRWRLPALFHSGDIKGFTELNNDLNVKTNEFNKLR
jgi:hypothetical protein